MSSTWTMLATALSAASWIDITRRYLKDRHRDQLHPRLSLSTLWGTDIVDAFGCPVVAARLINDGTRSIKISRLTISVTGTGYMEAINKGFNNEFVQDRPPIPDAEQETLLATLIPASAKNNDNGWVLERDDAAVWLFPAGNPGSHFFLDAKSSAIRIQAALFNGDLLDLADGKEFTALLSPLFDKCVEMNWMTTSEMQFAISFVSRTLPKYPKPGTLNSREITAAQQTSLMHLEDRMPISCLKWVQPPRRRRTV